MEITLTLTEAQQFGMGLYATQNGYADVESAVAGLIEASSQMLISEEYKNQQQSKTPDEMLAELSA